MIYNNYNSNEKISKKFLPKFLRTRVVVFSFIVSEDEVGITLYKNIDKYMPTNYVFDVNFDGKLKRKTFGDLERMSATIFMNNREYIKKTIEKFETDYMTKVELEDVADRYMIVAEGKNTIFEKQIFCILKHCNEIEHTINPEFVRDCIVVPLSNLQDFLANNCVADYCLDFLSNFQ